MKIKKISIQDLNIIRNLALEIWPICYKNILQTDQIEFMLQKFYAVESLENLFKKNHDFIIIYQNQVAVGFASFELNALRQKTKLHKIYVLPQNWGNNCGFNLLKWIENESKLNNQTHVFLNVNKNNNAIGFYQKNNFEIILEEVIQIGNGFVMDDYVMEKVL